MAPSDKADGAFEPKSHYGATERDAEESLEITGPPNTTDGLDQWYGDTKNDLQDMHRLGKKREFKVLRHIKVNQVEGKRVDELRCSGTSTSYPRSDLSRFIWQHGNLF
jgi:hypothetical protein